MFRRGPLVGQPAAPFPDPPDVDAPTAPPASSAARSDRIGRYRITGELGRGGMGVVYRAHDERLGRSVALKLLPAHLGADAKARERLAVEARAAAALDHPNVCTVYEVAETDDGRPYIAFACYDGQTLRDRLGGGALPVPEAVRIAREVASGVEAAHTRGIVHRDLKPSNVFLCEDGTAKVLDFGIARLQDVVLTPDGETPGTVEYGAPETASGRGDARSDVWSLGVVLYEMLTGRRPFSGGYPAAVLYAVLHEEPPPPSALNPDVPKAVDAVVMRCLAKDPEDRYADAGAVAEALGVEAPRPEAAALRVMGRQLRRSRAWQVGAAAAVLSVGGVGAWHAASGAGDGLPRAIHLAVLPPEAIPDEGETRDLADGLAETLTAGISELDARHVDVMPMSDVRAEQVESARQAGVRLRANLALTGSLHRQGDRLTLTLNLVTTGERPRILATRPLTFSDRETHRVREQALRAIAAMLDVEITDDAADRLGSGTDDPEAERYLRMGVKYLERDRDADDLDVAVALFEQAIEEDSTFAEAHARLGEALLAKYDATRDSAFVRQAQAAAETAERFGPRAPSVHVTLSKLFLATGATGRAIVHAERALAAAPASVPAALALAAARARGGDTAGAEVALRDLAAQSPESWIVALQLGRFLFDRNEFGDAADVFARVTELAPENVQGYLGLGGALQRTGDADGAETAYRAALALRPDAYAALSNLGTLAQARGDASAAATFYDRALQVDSTDHVVWANLASAYDVLGDRTRWRNALRRALHRVTIDLSVDDADPADLVSAATYRLVLGDPEAAARLASEAVALAPESPDVLFEAASVLDAAGESSAARGAVQHALTLASIDGVPWDYPELQPYE